MANSSILFVLFPWSYSWSFHLHVQLSSSFSLSTFQAICVVCNNNKNINVGQWWNFYQKLDCFFLKFPCFLVFCFIFNIFSITLVCWFLFFYFCLFLEGYHQKSRAHGGRNSSTYHNTLAILIVNYQIFN